MGGERGLELSVKEAEVSRGELVEVEIGGGSEKVRYAESLVDTGKVAIVSFVSMSFKRDVAAGADDEAEDTEG
jgi:hypothetical protein